MIKIFIGFPLTTELRIQLSKSSSWKRVSVSRLSEPDDLMEIRHEGKEFIGRFVGGDQVPLSDLQAIEKVIQEKMLSYCPEFKSANATIFPQVFIQ